MNSQSIVLTLLLTLLLALCSPFAWAELAVVAHPDKKMISLDRAQLVNIYMGRYRQWPDGGAALPADLKDVKERFYRALVDKDLAEINSYWARLVFSGQVSPPVQLKSVTQVLEYVRRNQGALAFIDEADVPDDLKVVARLTEAAPQ
jgi:ABC-type phosphate transport system substrate-binding protein